MSATGLRLTDRASAWLSFKFSKRPSDALLDYCARWATRLHVVVRLHGCSRSVAPGARHTCCARASAWVALDKEGGPMTDRTAASALSTNCARCYARPGDLCLSVRGPRRGQPKAWVHNARKRAAA